MHADANVVAVPNVVPQGVNVALDVALDVVVDVPRVVHATAKDKLDNNNPKCIECIKQNSLYST